MAEAKNIIKNLIEQIDEKLRSCANCGFPTTVPNTMLCSYCHHVVLKQKSLRSKNIIHQRKSIKAYSLFDWTPNECNALSALVLALKGSAPPKVWLEYAALFVNHRMSQAVFPQDLIIVPCPSLNREKDHAWYFAKAVSELVNRPLLQLFQRGDCHYFRKASKLDREAHLKSRLHFSENITQTTFENRNIIFIDDIITTGTTVKSAYTHLDKAKSFEAWSLAYRMK